MTGWKLFLSSWDFYPSVVVGCALMWGAYLRSTRFAFTGKAINFTLGVLVIFLALVSPLDALGDNYLFSAHMAQHIMLGLIAPSLLITGLPASFVQFWLRMPLIGRVERVLGHPPLALIIGIATFWLWHLPALYNATLQNELVHIFEHLTFLVSGTILWWPVFKPVPEGKLSALKAVIYMAIASMINAILGITFTWAETPFYAGYMRPRDPLGALDLIRNKWGLDAINDQKLGGAIMWAGGGVIYLWCMMVCMVQWFTESES